MRRGLVEAWLLADAIRLARAALGRADVCETCASRKPGPSGRPAPDGIPLVIRPFREADDGSRTRNLRLGNAAGPLQAGTPGGGAGAPPCAPPCKHIRADTACAAVATNWPVSRQTPREPMPADTPGLPRNEGVPGSSPGVGSG